MTKTEKALALLETGEWITSTQFVEAGCGYRYGGRIQDLRNKGYEVEKRRVRGTLWEYQLRGRPIGDHATADPEPGHDTPGGGNPERITGEEGQIGDSGPSSLPLFEMEPEPSHKGPSHIDPDQR